MDKILSKDEMNALLNANASVGGESGVANGDSDKLSVYDFRRPERFTKEAVHALSQLHERFCLGAAASLSGFFRTRITMTVVSVEQANYAGFLQSLPNPTLAVALSLRPLDGLAVMEVGLEAVYPMIDRLLGGAGGAQDAGRKMTEIEKNVILGVIQMIAGELKDAWKPVAEISFHLQANETEPGALQTSPPGEVVLVVAIEIRMGDAPGFIHLCLPHSALAPVLETFARKDSEELKDESGVELRKALDVTLRAPLEVSCALPVTMVRVDDLLHLSAKDIMKLDSKVGDPVVLSVAGKASFYAALTEINGNKGAGILGRVAE
ncbi:MAG TPA: FliM/FliN family flagellar motor switch protein [Terriglobia bacterium]|nr:FliM/FliN family flagellar motor switch protein [Terriglobia bacterium]